MLLCEHCIQAIKSRREPLYVGELFLTAEECEEANTNDKPLIDRHIINAICCDWCGEIDDLYQCL